MFLCIASVIIQTEAFFKRVIATVTAGSDPQAGEEALALTFPGAGSQLHHVLGISAKLQVSFLMYSIL